ncbi:MAG: hypothetical protein IH602_00365 [Bryobacteraceae bacterium]|nr:hypothetical protein [Bryobacteraceae bacterium]
MPTPSQIPEIPLTDSPGTWLRRAAAFIDRRSGALIAGFITLAILLRLLQWYHSRSLWFDEAVLALNLIERDYLSLARPLDYDQAAPAGFLALLKLASSVFGTGERAFRLIPVLAGILAFPLFHLFLRRHASPLQQLAGIVLLATSYTHLLHSIMMKQYAPDALAGIVLCLLLPPLLTSPLTPSRFALYTVTGCLAVWFSHPSTFVLASFGLVAIVHSLHLRDWKKALWTSLMAAFWLASFGGLYLLSVSADAQNAYLLQFWSRYFAPFPFHDTASFLWYPWSFFDLFRFTCGYTFPGIATGLFIVGVCHRWLANRPLCLALLGPLAFALLASALRLYAFGDRLMLFWLPILIFFMAEGLATLAESRLHLGFALAALFGALLCVHPTVDVVTMLKRPYLLEESRPVLRHVERSLVPGDDIYLYYGAVAAFRYYQTQGILAGAQPIEGYSFGMVPSRPSVAFVESRNARSHWKLYLEDLDRLRSRKRVWVVFSHLYKRAEISEEQFFLDHLNSFGRQISRFEAEGASAYLFNFSASPDATQH